MKFVLTMMPTETMLAEIAAPPTTRKDVALSYAMALLSEQPRATDWWRVNQAIIDRWSVSALQWIRRARGNWPRNGSGPPPGERGGSR